MKCNYYLFSIDLDVSFHLAVTKINAKPKLIQLGSVTEKKLYVLCCTSQLRKNFDIQLFIGKF